MVQQWMMVVLLTTGAFAEPLHLPAECSAALDEKVPGWKYFDAQLAVQKFVREEFGADARPELVAGDWNADGRRDYAALIRKPGSAENQIAAFVSGANGFVLRTLQGADYLETVPKGATGFNFEVQKPFRYPTDAIFAATFQKAGSSYVWKGDKFKRLATSD